MCSAVAAWDHLYTHWSSQRGYMLPRTRLATGKPLGISPEHPSHVPQTMSYCSSSNLDNTIADIFDDADEHGVVETLLHAIDADRTASRSGGCAGRMRLLATIQLGLCFWYMDYLLFDLGYPPSGFRSIFRIPIHV